MTPIPMAEKITLQAATATKLREAVMHLCSLSPDYAAWLEVAFWRLSQAGDGQLGGYPRGPVRAGAPVAGTGRGVL